MNTGAVQSVCIKSTGSVRKRFKKKQEVDTRRSQIFHLHAYRITAHEFASCTCLIISADDGALTMNKHVQDANSCA